MAQIQTCLSGVTTLKRFNVVFQVLQLRCVQRFWRCWRLVSRHTKDVQTKRHGNWQIDKCWFLIDVLRSTKRHPGPMRNRRNQVACILVECLMCQMLDKIIFDFPMNHVKTNRPGSTSPISRSKTVSKMIQTCNWRFKFHMTWKIGTQQKYRYALTHPAPTSNW